MCLLLLKSDIGPITRQPPTPESSSISCIFLSTDAFTSDLSGSSTTCSLYNHADAPNRESSSRQSMASKARFSRAPQSDPAIGSIPPAFILGGKSLAIPQPARPCRAVLGVVDRFQQRLQTVRVHPRPAFHAIWPALLLLGERPPRQGEGGLGQRSIGKFPVYHADDSRVRIWRDVGRPQVITPELKFGPLVSVPDVTLRCLASLWNKCRRCTCAGSRFRRPASSLRLL